MQTKSEMINRIAELAQKNAELKAENEQLKEEINKLGKKHEDYCNIMYWQMKEQMDKHLGCLQEIKAIVEKCMNKDTCYDCEYCDDCYIEDAEIPTYDVCKLLIQKITKAESEG